MLQTYQDALDWIYSFLDSEKKLPKNPTEFNLPRVKAMLALLDNPQLRYPAVIVAGTKGKGSTCAFLESIARHSGLKVGFFSSPHLHSYRERIQINREPISQIQLVELINQVQPLLEQLDPELGSATTYEIGVVLGLYYFATQAIELAVLEIGLGGRYDAINSVDPVLSVIASISYDHTAILGDTLAKIAYEKAGIIKQHVPVISTVQQAEAAEVIGRIAAEQAAPLFIAGMAGLQEQASGVIAEYPLVIVPDQLGLKGDFQMQNAQLAASAAMLLRELGFPISDDAIRQGLATTQWPARFEQIANNPVTIVDGAHNGDSARVLLQALKQHYPKRPLTLVLGTSSDKDIQAIIQQLSTAATKIITTCSRHPRALAPERLAEMIQSTDARPVHQTNSVAEALTLAQQLTTVDGLICVTGSLFVAAEAREVYGLAQPD
ncbi:bifunctional folylpolyglutamate synthase/dihydrofolate synthase [Herpetosiphon geysericola]|uniref:tetrahydrofolate synthase n=1 Tax=Herpetosiphon geysericola TaxID=70996 RepID=A0A0P6XQG1_9CHLR|nr:folylpolyglutamate synthase/dihydrofolate synthase family protein [Herpetosiphon geysericola]KPL86207.1 hypothetical protein SE18_15285 [Herpetosiphon geysericola]